MGHVSAFYIITFPFIGRLSVPTSAISVGFKIELEDAHELVLRLKKKKKIVVLQIQGLDKKIFKKENTTKQDG